MMIDLENETPRSLAQAFASNLLNQVSRQANDPRYTSTIKTMIVSAQLSAQAVFLSVFEGEIDAEQALKILGKIEGQFKSFIVEKFI